MPPVTFRFEESVYSFVESVLQNSVCVIVASGTVTQSVTVLVESGTPGDSATGVLLQKCSYLVHIIL